MIYKDVRLDCAYRMDIMVDHALVIELKSIDKLLPIHDAQMLTYLRLSHCPVGLLLNFGAPTLKDGLRRLVL